jgi:omega-amidase
MQNTALRLTLLQADLIWEDATANLSQFEAMLRNLSEPTDFILLPEMFTTGFSMRSEALAEPMHGATMRWLAAQAAAHQAVVAGSFIVVEAGKYYNRFVLMRPDGSFEYYDKRHLFGMGGEDKHYTAGEKRLIFEWKGWRIAPFVCYDLRFPVWSRNTAGYDLLLYAANWPVQRIAHWRTLLQARAIENQAFAVGCNRIGTDGHGVYYSGNSMMIAPDGLVLFEKTHQAAVQTQVFSKLLLNKTRDFLPFLKDADDFILP